MLRPGPVRSGCHQWGTLALRAVNVEDLIDEIIAAPDIDALRGQVRFAKSGRARSRKATAHTLQTALLKRIEAAKDERKGQLVDAVRPM